MVSPRLFNIISWSITGVIVLLLAGLSAWQVMPKAPTVGNPGTTPEVSTGNPGTLPVIEADADSTGIVRSITLKTDIPERPEYDVIEYIVGRGDSIFGIAGEYDLKPETVLASNFDVLEDDPHSLRIGQVLKIPPVDGIYYEWHEGDTLESVSDEFEVDSESILSWVGNKIDLTNPEVQPGEWVMIPGGVKTFVIPVFSPRVVQGSSSTSTQSRTCGSAVGSGWLNWPTANHYLSGNDFWAAHRAIDIAATEGVPVYAADSGVVVRADSSGAWNYGYGIYLMIDHGYYASMGSSVFTLYAHLSSLTVSECSNVYSGQVIGYAGNTGNSTGAHLHFEIRTGDGGFINPWDVLP